MGRHAKFRAIQRYNVDLSWSDEKNILSKIRNGKCFPLPLKSEELKEGDDKVEFAYVVLRSVPLKVCYATSDTGLASKIITIYPFNVEEYNAAQDADIKNHLKNSIDFLKENGYIVYKRKVKK